MLVSGSCQSSREEGINNVKRCKVGGNAIIWIISWCYENISEILQLNCTQGNGRLRHWYSIIFLCWKLVSVVTGWLLRAPLIKSRYTKWRQKRCTSLHGLKTLLPSRYKLAILRILSLSYQTHVTNYAVTIIVYY